jgi:hypothetical protein
MNNKTIMILTGILMASILGSAAYAMNSSVTAGIGASIKLKAWTNQSVLTSAYDAISCTTAYAGSMVNQTIAADPGLSSLNNDMLAVAQGNAHLQTYIASSNVTGFTTYLHAIYDPALVGLYLKGRNAIIFDHNLTLSEKLKLRDDFINGLPGYRNCVAGSLVNISQDKLTFYNNSEANFAAQENRLSANGVNTANMTIVLQGAQTEIIQPYQAAIGSGANTTQIWAALKQYCLYDGCPNGLNYHLDARFTIAKLDAIAAKVSTVSNDTVDLNNAQASLNSASTELAIVGTAQYSGGNGVKIWTNIRSAEVSLHGALKKLQG